MNTGYLANILKIPNNRIISLCCHTAPYHLVTPFLVVTSQLKCLVKSVNNNRLHRDPEVNPNLFSSVFMCFHHTFFQIWQFWVWKMRIISAMSLGYAIITILWMWDCRRAIHTPLFAESGLRSHARVQTCPHHDSGSHLTVSHRNTHCTRLWIIIM